MDLNFEKILKLVLFATEYDKISEIRLSLLAKKTGIRISALLKILSKLEIEYTNNPNHKFTAKQVDRLLNYIVKNFDKVSFEEVNYPIAASSYEKLMAHLFTQLSSPITQKNNDIYTTIEFDKPEENQTIFRYRKWDEHCKDSLQKKYIYHSNIGDFNDPFDCIANQIPFFNLDNLSKKQKKIQLDQSKKARLLVENYINHTKVACFSLIKDSILMWSHYASNHSGICIEYDSNYLRSEEKYEQKNILKKKHWELISRSINFYNDFFKVRYVDNLVRAYDFKSLNIPSLYLRKYVDWEYENEVRRVIYVNNIYDKNEKKVYHRPEAIKAIYLGAKSSNKTEKEIRDIITEKYKNQIPLFKSNLEMDSFKINFIKLN